MKKLGRPSKFTQDLADKICEIISTSERGLRSICAELQIDPASVYRWLDEHKSFCEQYARAKENQADFLIDQMIEIADDGSRDTKTIKGRDGSLIEVEDTEWTSRSRLKVDTRKWIASKLKPKKYGDKLDIAQTITVEQPLFPDAKPMD